MALLVATAIKQVPRMSGDCRFSAVQPTGAPCKGPLRLQSKPFIKTGNRHDLFRMPNLSARAGGMERKTSEL